MKKKLRIIGLVILLAVLATGNLLATMEQPGKKGEKFLEAREAYALIQKNKTNLNFVVLDVRTPEEFKDGHVEGAININYDSLAFKTEMAKLDRKKTYFVYCRTGRRSTEAVRIMRELEFTKIIRMKGDILKWQAENLPLVR